MPSDVYHILNEATEDRFDSAENLQDAIRIAREWAQQVEAGDTVSIEYKGLTIRQLMRTPDGRIEEEEIR